MPAPVIDLPEDLESLRAFALAMAEKAAYAEAEVVVLRDRETDLKDRVERLHDILKKLSRGQYGRKSEKLRATSSTDEDDQMDFLFEELATGVAALEAEINKSKAKSSPREARPTDEAAMKLLFLVLNRSEKEWKMPPREWSMAKSQFAVMFGDRFKAAMA